MKAEERKRLEEVTFKYHRHLDGSEIENMMYFTLDDVHCAMKEYAKSYALSLLEEYTDEVIYDMCHYINDEDEEVINEDQAMGIEWLRDELIKKLK